MHISKYNQHDLYIVFVYIFAGLNICYWEINWCALLWEKSIPFSQHSSKASIALCCGKDFWVYPISVCLYIAAFLCISGLEVMSVGLYGCNFWYHGETLWVSSLFFFLLLSFHALLYNALWAMHASIVSRYILGTGFHSFSFQLVMVFCSGFHILPRVASLLKAKVFTYLWVWVQLFRV